MIRLDDVSFSYGDADIFKKFNLTIDTHLSILGKSGCGKTTLLHLISGIIVPYDGDVTINDISNKNFRNKIGLLMQKGGVFPYKTVYNNISLGLLKDKDRGKKTYRMAEILGLSDKLEKYPSQLSGGQVQRTALGRVLCMKPEILLLDEPFSQLDEITRQSLQDEVLGIVQKENMMLITVTHSIEEAVKLGNRVIVLSDKGTIIRDYDVADISKRDINFYKKCIEIKQDIEEDLL